MNLVSICKQEFFSGEQAYKVWELYIICLEDGEYEHHITIEFTNNEKTFNHSSTDITVMVKDFSEVPPFKELIEEAIELIEERLEEGDD